MITLFKKPNKLPTPKAEKAAIKKQASLFLLSCLLILVFFLLPRNRVWLFSKPLAYLNEFPQQFGRQDPEHRKRQRWGPAYTVSMQIAALLAPEQNKKDLLVLMPPKDYFTERKIDYPVPEPAVFYYYTGLKTVWANSREAFRANRMVRAFNGRLMIDTIADKTKLADSLQVFRKYKISL